MKTKIFLDGGDPVETKEILKLGVTLDGQTTNPSLIAKNPAAQARLAAGDLFTAAEVKDFYKAIVTEIASLVPGSVSIEVAADKDTTAEAMIAEGREMNQWIDTAHIKLPTIPAGLEAARVLTSEGIRVNMTLVFTQAQAAAVYAATTGTQPGDVFVSPFVGRYNDIDTRGLDIVENITEMYHSGDGHVQVLMASVRDLPSFVYAIEEEIDIITAPGKIIQAWHEAGSPTQLTEAERAPLLTGLAEIPYEEVALTDDWQQYNVQHDLTDKGLQKFADDWNGLVAK